jgi:hypothetical protein
MTQLIPFLRNKWDELLITGIYLNAFVASIFAGDAIKVLEVSLGGLALLAVVFGLRELWNRRAPPLRGENIAFKVPRRALAFTVGFQIDTIRMAIKAQKPEFVGFICSEDSLQKVSLLKAEFNYDTENSITKIVKPNDINDIRTETGLVLDWLMSKGVKPSEVAADITGGTTIMSAGVFSLTEDRRIDSQYIFCHKYQNNKCADGTQEAVFVSHYGNV